VGGLRCVVASANAAAYRRAPMKLKGKIWMSAGPVQPRFNAITLASKCRGYSVLCRDAVGVGRGGTDIRLLFQPFDQLLVTPIDMASQGVATELFVPAQIIACGAGGIDGRPRSGVGGPRLISQPGYRHNQNYNNDSGRDSPQAPHNPPLRVTISAAQMNILV